MTRTFTTISPCAWRTPASKRCADIEEASAIITFCTSQSALEDAYFDEERVRFGASGAVLIDFSASTPGFARELGAVATVSDLGFVEAPVALEDMLDPRPFDEENLVCYVAGEEDAVAAAQGLLNAVCGRVVECGAAGTAQLMRAVRTLQEAAAVVSAIEANALVRAAHRAALGNGLSDVVISGLSRPPSACLGRFMKPLRGRVHGGDVPLGAAGRACKC